MQGVFIFSYISTYIILYIYIYIYGLIYKYGSLKTSKIKKKQLRKNTLQFEKNFKLMNIPPNDMDKFEKNS